VREKLDSLSTFMLHPVLSDGTFPLIGDDDGGRLIALDSLDPGDVRGLIALCAVSLNRGDLKAIAGDCAEAVWWLWGRKGIDIYESLKVSSRKKQERCFRKRAMRLQEAAGKMGLPWSPWTPVRLGLATAATPTAMP